MGAETGSRTSIEQETENFLAENYPVRKVDVKEILDVLKNHSEREGETVRSVIDYHINHAIHLAKDSIFDRKPRRGGPEILHVPALLTAIREFEKKHSKEIVFPQMPLSRYVGILAVGEISGMLRSGHEGRSFNKEKLEGHQKRLNELLSLQERLRLQNL